VRRVDGARHSDQHVCGVLGIGLQDHVSRKQKNTCIPEVVATLEHLLCASQVWLLDKSSQRHRLAA
jgi:hypothetical protein